MAADIWGNSSVYLLTVPNGKGYVGYSDGPLDERWKNGDGSRGHPEFFADIEKYGWENIGKRAVMRGMSKEVVRNCEPFLSNGLIPSGPTATIRTAAVHPAITDANTQRIKSVLFLVGLSHRLTGRQGKLLKSGPVSKRRQQPQKSVPGTFL